MFTLYYQPKIDLKKNKIVGAEALIRKIEKVEGEEGRRLIFPGEFIPQAEENGEIIKIDNWVFKRIVKDAREIFVSTQDKIKLSFNVSGIHFKEKSLFDDLKAMFLSTKDFLSLFEIEITETALIEDEKKASTILEELKKIGFSLSIDDFGVGCGALTYLKDFPIDTLKIDKSFVDEMLNNKKVAGIVESLICLCNKIGLTSIAEGVEEVEQVEFLKNLKCDEIQGYYFSKPMPLKKFIAFVNSFNETEKKSAFIHWSKHYSTGSYAFDSHHMIIVNLLNKLFEILKNTEKRKNFEINYFIDILDDYLKMHFDLENRFMRKYHYPFIQKHLTAHKTFLNEYEKLKENLTNVNERNLFNLFNLLKEWFLEHEIKEDKNLIEYIKKHRN